MSILNGNPAPAVLEKPLAIVSQDPNDFHTQISQVREKFKVHEEHISTSVIVLPVPPKSTMIQGIGNSVEIKTQLVFSAFYIVSDREPVTKSEDH